MTRRRGSLIFLFRRRHLSKGSTTMRAQQLAALVAPHLPDVAVKVQSFSRKPFLQYFWARTVPQGATIFATKDAVRVLRPETVRLLQARGCAVCLDLVDMPFHEWPGAEMGADCLVSPSLDGMRLLHDHVARAHLSGPRPLVAPVLHNADYRLYGLAIRPQDRARMVYWGAPTNGVLPPAITARVDVLDGGATASFAASLDRVRDYNTHYAIRPHEPGERCIKPFTKGVNAAVLRATILTDRQAEDAVALLGEDYPFLAASKTEADILSCLDHLHDSFGGPDWQLAQERCRDMAERVSPMALAAQIAHIIAEVHR